MTIVITYLSDKPVQGRGNAKSRRKTARAAKFAQAKVDKELRNKIASAASGLTERAYKAVSMPTVRSKQIITGSCCLPEVAKFRV